MKQIYYQRSWKKIKDAETGDVKLTPEEFIKEPKDQKVKIKKDELVVKPDEQTTTQVKVEENNEVKTDKLADDVLENKSTVKRFRRYIKDFNINKIESAEDIKNLIQKISLKFKDDIEFRKRGTQKQETTKALAIEKTK